MSAKKNMAAASGIESAPIPSLESSSSDLGQLTSSWLSSSATEFASDPKNRLAQNVVTRNDVMDVAIDRDAANVNHHFSVSIREQLGTEGLATSQQASGRCWLFAILNTLRLPLIKELELSPGFELSQNYLFFWDKVERANFFLETMITTAEEPYDGRLIQWLLSQPVSDGGQWDMAVNLILKYGVMPKEIFPESHSATSSARMNYMLTNKLREFGGELRNLSASGASQDRLRETKLEMMKVVHRIVSIHLGTPPTTFNWQYTDKANKYHCVSDLTPQSFYTSLVQPHVDVTAKVSLINDPRNEYYSLFTVDKLNNMAGGRPVTYLNLPVEELMKYAMKTIDAGQPVWFGCDCGKFMMRETGLFSVDAFDYDLIYGAAPGMDKVTRLNLGESLMTHAMVFTAYDKAEGEALPSKWRVENSWGRAAADDGYYVMTKEWFEEWMYQVAIDVGILSPDVAEVLSKPAELLPAWDPMGSLAGGGDGATAAMSRL